MGIGDWGYDRQDEYIRKMTSVKRVNTDEEVYFERKDEELSITPDKVVLHPCKIIKILWNIKIRFLFGIIVTAIYGALPVLRGYYMGKEQMH